MIKKQMHDLALCGIFLLSAAPLSYGGENKGTWKAFAIASAGFTGLGFLAHHKGYQSKIMPLTLIGIGAGLGIQAYIHWKHKEVRIQQRQLAHQSIRSHVATIAQMTTIQGLHTSLNALERAYDEYAIIENEHTRLQDVYQLKKEIREEIQKRIPLIVEHECSEICNVPWKYNGTTLTHHITPIIAQYDVYTANAAENNKNSERQRLYKKFGFDYTAFGILLHNACEQQLLNKIEGTFNIYYAGKTNVKLPTLQQALSGRATMLASYLPLPEAIQIIENYTPLSVQFAEESSEQAISNLQKTKQELDADSKEALALLRASDFSQARKKCSDLKLQFVRIIDNKISASQAGQGTYSKPLSHEEPWEGPLREAQIKFYEDMYRENRSSIPAQQTMLQRLAIQRLQ